MVDYSVQKLLMITCWLLGWSMDLLGCKPVSERLFCFLLNWTVLTCAKINRKMGRSGQERPRKWAPPRRVPVPVPVPGRGVDGGFGPRRIASLGSAGARRCSLQ